ncbi:hypothetical protein BDC45DRAFT_534240 [Circinella umbellata]|nr:hypothetical protein BDC45DRAFT_534240 [Circinella umbellata]
MYKSSVRKQIIRRTTGNNRKGRKILWCCDEEFNPLTRTSQCSVRVLADLYCFQLIILGVMYIHIDGVDIVNDELTRMNSRDINGMVYLNSNAMVVVSFIPKQLPFDISRFILVKKNPSLFDRSENCIESFL